MKGACAGQACGWFAGRPIRSAAARDRGADVRPGPDGQRHHLADAGRRGLCARCHPRVDERGFDALDPKWSGGRPKAIGERVRAHIRLIARTSPADWNIAAFSTWSLAKLAKHLVERHVVPRISRETLRRILREGNVYWQSTTTWKTSTDPDFIAKMHRVLALYDTRPADGRVICVDEFGPLNLMPRRAKRGARQAGPAPTTSTAG
ncbi:helix-turn-helix domain-containing protein [Streptomyces sp. NPDC019443]|uniref:helix-turn-helix domain-containing protein n=1 Tax=Streptomyces sp. NPDC019443 TaxID=3365061 RepID=UPI0037B143CF